MSDSKTLDRLKDTPISDMNFGSVALRRSIIQAGFESIVDLLNLSEREIDDKFDWNEADEIIAMQERYRKSPEDFAVTVLAKRKSAARPIAESTQAKGGRVAETPKRHVSSIPRSYYTGDGPRSLPSLPFSDALRGYEKRAREVFDDLDDSHTTVMVYQSFDEFSTELDEIAEAFDALFRFYMEQPRAALNLIDRHLRNIFIVYVADRARSVYREGNLWGNFFDGMPFDDENVRAAFKQLFASQVERRNMPIYARDEAANYYYYTALLHGGLSGDFWEDLWQESLLPLAREIAKGYYGFGGEMDGHAILKEIKNPESRFAPKTTVLNILEKAPDSTIAPLFEASLKVAVQVESAKQKPGDRSEYTMLSSYGLPDLAMQALRETQELKASRGKGAGCVRASQRGKDARYIYLPMAALHLDLASGTVCMRWPRQQFPLHFGGYRIDYYINGKRAFSQPFQAGVGKCLLEPVEISVEPQARYDIELKMMQVDGDGETANEKSSLPQTFTRNKPGCFEFIKDHKGMFRLRERNERIGKKRRIAYMVKAGLRIEPGPGMRAVSEYETGGEWDEARIFIYDVEPGASGSLVDERSGEEVAVWQERYSARIDKRRIIGETTRGLDLFGYAPCELGTNGGLPSVSIEAFGGLDVLEDLEISCKCDDKRVSLPRHVLWDDENEGDSSAKIALVPQESSMFDWHIETCVIEARQKSAGGKLVFRYRFAVVPIQNFRLESASFDYETAVADYGFQTTTAANITNSQGESREVNAWGRYSARTLLEDEFLCLKIESTKTGKVTEAKLALAALNAEIPQGLVEVSRRHPVCLADALELGASEGNFRVTARGWKYNRAVLVMAGEFPLFYKELKQPGTYEFNLFKDARLFVPDDCRSLADRTVVLSIMYGDDVSQGYLKPAWTDVEIVRSQQGVGIFGWDLLMRADGAHVLRFSGKPLCDLHIDFSRKASSAIIGSVDVPANATEVVIPEAVVRRIDTGKEIHMTMTPTDWFGKPEYEYAVVSLLERSGKGNE